MPKINGVEITGMTKLNDSDMIENGPRAMLPFYTANKPIYRAAILPSSVPYHPGGQRKARPPSKCR